MSLLVKIHKKDDRTVVAVCDENLRGQTFEENNKQLDLTNDFYDGEKRETQEIGDLIRNADAVNLVGEEAVQLGMEEGVIDPDNVLTIGGVPHAQAVLMHD